MRKKKPHIVLSDGIFHSMAFLFDGMFYFVHFVGASFAYSVTFADKTINEQLKPALK